MEKATLTIDFLFLRKTKQLTKKREKDATKGGIAYKLNVYNS